MWLFGQRHPRQKDQSGQRPPGAAQGVSKEGAQVTLCASNEVSSHWATLPLKLAWEVMWSPKVTWLIIGRPDRH